MKTLTRKEEGQLKKALDDFEVQTLYGTGMAKLSGGFAEADMFDYDEEIIDVELKWGVQSDVENMVYTETASNRQEDDEDYFLTRGQYVYQAWKVFCRDSK